MPFQFLYKRLGKRFFLYYFFAYLFYELLVLFKVGISARFFIYTIYYAIPYGLILSLGLFYDSFGMGAKRKVCLTSVTVYTVLAIVFFVIKGRYISTQIFKYPPRIYWISYSLFVSYGLLILCSKFEKCRMFDNLIVRFIGRNTLWIYLWHIPFVTLSGIISDFWCFRFIIIVFGAIAVYFLQYLIVLFIKNKCGEKANCITKFLLG